MAHYLVSAKPDPNRLPHLEQALTLARQEPERRFLERRLAELHT